MGTVVWDLVVSNHQALPRWRLHLRTALTRLGATGHLWCLSRPPGR